MDSLHNRDDVPVLFVGTKTFGLQTFTLAHLLLHLSEFSFRIEFWRLLLSIMSEAQARRRFSQGESQSRLLSLVASEVNEVANKCLSTACM